MKIIQSYKILLILIISLLGPSLAYSQKRKAKAPIESVTIATPKDSALYKKAVGGNADAQAWVGVLYYLGEGGVQENNTEALRWLRKSKNEGSPFGEYWLGIMYSNGIGSTDNVSGSRMLKAAIPKIEVLANDSVADAQFLMGEIYQYGTNNDEGIEDLNTALNWYRLAANQGHIGAIEAGKECCGSLWGYNSRGLLNFLIDASTNNNPKALYELLKYHFQGLGFPQSYEKEAELLLRASDLGFEEATLELADRYENGIGIEQNTPEAIKLYEKVGFYYRIGELYRDGIGIDRDYDQAIRYFGKAFIIHRDSEAKKNKLRL